LSTGVKQTDSCICGTVISFGTKKTAFDISNTCDTTKLCNNDELKHYTNGNFIALSMLTTPRETDIEQWNKARITKKDQETLEREHVIQEIREAQEEINFHGIFTRANLAPSIVKVVVITFDNSEIWLDAPFTITPNAKEIILIMEKCGKLEDITADGLIELTRKIAHFGYFNSDYKPGNVCNSGSAVKIIDCDPAFFPPKEFVKIVNDTYELGKGEEYLYYSMMLIFIMSMYSELYTKRKVAISIEKKDFYYRLLKELRTKGVILKILINIGNIMIYLRHYEEMVAMFTPYYLLLFYTFITKTPDIELYLQQNNATERCKHNRKILHTRIVEEHMLMIMTILQKIFDAFGGGSNRNKTTKTKEKQKRIKRTKTRRW
jgi:hypothetical protein